MGQYQQRISSNDDNYYYWPGGSLHWFQAIELGNSDWGGLAGFFRWRNVDVPQGSTITSAYITLSRWYDSTLTIKNRIYGIDEDNTADYTSDATGRALTSASVDWNPNSSWTENVEKTSGDIKSVIQEIINRGGWSSGNSLGIRINDNGGTAGDNGPFVSKGTAGTYYPQLTINYTGGSSPSSSVSPSSSISLSLSPSPSPSPSLSLSPSPSPMASFHGLRIAKSGRNVLLTDNPSDMIFDSDYGTLKYFDKQTLAVQFDANNDVTGKNTYTHDLGYYPFVEVFVRVYIGAPSGGWEYCPFAGAGATILYKANYKLTTTDITVYGEIDGISTSVWNFEFLIFMYKNDLKLS